MNIEPRYGYLHADVDFVACLRTNRQFFMRDRRISRIALSGIKRYWRAQRNQNNDGNEKIFKKQQAKKRSKNTEQAEHYWQTSLPSLH